MRLRLPALALLVSLVAGALPATPAAAKPPSVHLSSRVVVVSAATVRRYLAGVSADGHTLRFRHAAGGLARLRAGSVMLIPGSDALGVVVVRHAHGQLIVMTKAATLTQMMTSGSIQYHGRPNVRAAFPVHLNTGISARAAFFGPAARFGPGVIPAAAGSFTAQGSVGHYGFVLTFTPASSSRLDISGTICYQWGAVCSAGPSRGFSAQLNVNGYIDVGQADVGLTMTNGHVDQSLFSLKNLLLHTHFTYTIISGDQKDHGNPPLLRLPFGVDFTIPGPSGIPLYLKVQLALLLKFGIPSYGAVLRGGMNVTSGGTDTIAKNGAGVSAAGSGEQVNGTALTHQAGDVGPSQSNLPSAVVVGFEGQVGAGVGVTMGNLIGFLNGVSVVTQRTAPAFGGLAGVDCSIYHVAYSVSMGFGGQLGPFSFTGPPKTLVDRQGDVKETGC
ncbi:MAG TPA: hypothetical protein VIX82_02280 [Solirubrobacteraceae bacterium]